MPLPAWCRRPGPQTILGYIRPFQLSPLKVSVEHERDMHMHVVGSTKTGKSKFLEGLMLEDMLAGRTIGLVDPHTDLSRNLLRSLLTAGYFNSETALQNVIYVDPSRKDFVIPFNVLAADFDTYTVAQMVLEAFRRNWPEALSEAPRFENVALSSLLALIETKQTLVQLPKFLTNKEFREDLLLEVTNTEVVEFFHDRFDKWGRETPLWIESVLNKVTEFTFNPILKRMLGAQENRLNFRRLIDEGKTLIFDLGRCEPKTRKLLGCLIVTGIEQAIMSRKDVSESARRPFYLFMDEFQNFAATTGSNEPMERIFSEARKYKGYMHVAHQTLSQLNERLLAGVDQVGIKVTFQVGRKDSEVLARSHFDVSPDVVKHTPNTDTQMPLYESLPNQWERFTSWIKNLKNRRAWVKRRSKPSVLICTKKLPAYTASEEDAQELETRLARLHGVPMAEVERGFLATVKAPVQLSDWVSATSKPIYTASG